MKKLIIILLISFSFLTYSKELNEIKNLEIYVKESILLNNGKKDSEYKLSYISPNFIRKDIFKPDLNKGEIYIYNGDKKIVYLPLFDQTTEEKLEKNENEILETINFILIKEKEDEEFKKSYYSKKIKEIGLNDGTRISIDKLKNIDGYLLPTVFTIYDGDIVIARLQVEKYKINLNVTVEELSKL